MLQSPSVVMTKARKFWWRLMTKAPASRRKSRRRSSRNSRRARKAKARSGSGFIFAASQLNTGAAKSAIRHANPAARDSGSVCQDRKDKSDQSFDPDFDPIGDSAVHRESDIQFAEADQTAWQARIDLIQPCEATLRVGEGHRRSNAADGNVDGAERAAA